MHKRTPTSFIQRMEEHNKKRLNLFTSYDATLNAKSSTILPGG